MRLLIKLVLAFCVIWSGWWFVAITGMEKGLNAAADALRNKGWQVGHSEIETSGFPLQLRAQLDDVKIASIFDDTSAKLDQINLSTPTSWPGDVTVHLPDTPILLASAGTLSQFQFTNGQANLRLRPGTALELQHVQARSDMWKFRLQKIPFLSGDAVKMGITQNEEDAKTYHIDIDIASLSPQAFARETIKLPRGWPKEFEKVNAALTTRFDRKLDRLALSSTPPQPQAITLHSLTAKWGKIDLNAIGHIDIDTNGIPTGEVNINLKNWRTLLDLVQNASNLPEPTRNQIELFMGALSSVSSDPNNLELPIKFADGRTTLNGLPLGPAPIIVLP